SVRSNDAAVLAIPALSYCDVGKPEMWFVHSRGKLKAMSLPIHVDAYSGYKANERPLRFWLDADIYEIVTIEERWHDPTAEYFKVRTADGKLFLLRYDEREDEWTLQSGFDGDALLARPNINLISVDASAIRQAEDSLSRANTVILK